MSLVQAIDLQLLRFKLFQISAILLEVSSLCTGTGWNSWLMNFDLVFLTDSFFSKMKPSEFISFLAFHIEVAMVNRIENGNESQICWMITKYYRNPDGRFFPAQICLQIFFWLRLKLMAMFIVDFVYYAFLVEEKKNVLCT